MEKNKDLRMKGKVFMNPGAMQYVVFIIIALILSWAVIEINKRFFRRRKADIRSPGAWAHLDTGQPDAAEGSLPGSDGDKETDDGGEPDGQARARQNGHYSESKKPL